MVLLTEWAKLMPNVIWFCPFTITRTMVSYQEGNIGLGSIDVKSIIPDMGFGVVFEGSSEYRNQL